VIISNINQVVQTHNDHIDLHEKLYYLWVETARFLCQESIKLELNKLADGAENSDARNRVISEVQSLSNIAEYIEKRVIEDLRPFVECTGKEVKLGRSASKKLRKIIHSSMFIALNIMVSKNPYRWINPNRGEKFDTAFMESVDCNDKQSTGRVLFTVHSGLQQLDGQGKLDEVVYKAKVILKPNVSVYKDPIRYL
jgi:hypothetical protein